MIAQKKTSRLGYTTIPRTVLFWFHKKAYSREQNKFNGTFMNFQTFFQGVRPRYVYQFSKKNFFFEMITKLQKKFMTFELNSSIFQGVCLSSLQNGPGDTFIPECTLIPHSTAQCKIHTVRDKVSDN